MVADDLAIIREAAERFLEITSGMISRPPRNEYVKPCARCGKTLTYSFTIGATYAIPKYSICDQCADEMFDNEKAGK